MVSTLVPGSSGQDSSPGWGHCVVFLARHLIITVPLSNQEYIKMSTGELLGTPNQLQRSDLRWTSIPFRGSTNTPGHYRNLVAIETG